MQKNNNISEVLDSADIRGHHFVDPDFHLNDTLPEASAESAAHFTSKFVNAKNAGRKRPTDDVSGGGVTSKTHFRIGGEKKGKKVLPSRVYMVKPYYEDMGDGDNWQYPLAGWAEMATNGLHHAAGLGHAAMKVHVFSHPDPSPHRNRNTNALAVEIEPNLTRISEIPAEYDPKQNKMVPSVKVPSSIRHDAVKLAAIDFLTNNQDRHGANLMYGTSPTDDYSLTGKGPMNQIDRLLAIDNGRSFQYMAPQRMYAPYRDYRNGIDHFHNYLAGGVGHLVDPTHLKVLPAWWEQHKKAIVDEFRRHLKAVKHPMMVSHLQRNFSDRVNVLDKVASDIKAMGSKHYFTRRATTSDQKKIHSRASVKMRRAPDGDDLFGA